MSKSQSLGTKLIVNSKMVGGLKTIGGIEISADTTDVTDLGSTDGYREKLPAVKDGGEVSLAGFLDGDDVGQDECYSLMHSGEVVPCTIVFPPKIGKTWSFNASITKFATSVDLEDAVAFESALTVSGKPTLATTQAGG